MKTPVRRLEYTQGTSDKFWEVWCDAATMFCRWGRIGSKGQEKFWFYGSTAAARSMASRKANQKIGKGYVEVFAFKDIVELARAKIAKKEDPEKPKAKKKAKRLTAKGRANRDALRQRQADEFTFKRRGPRIG